MKAEESRQPGPSTRSTRGFGQLSRTKVAILVVALLISMGIGYRVYQGASAPAETVVQGTPIPVTRGTLTATINAAGSVVSTREANLTFGASGTLAELSVAVGDAVTAGQEMAKLDTTNLEIALAQAQSNLRVAELKQRQLKASATAEDQAAAQAAYDSALAKYDEVANGPSEADLRAAEQGVAAAEASLTQAENSLAALKAQPDPDDVRQAEIALEQAKDSRYATQINRDLTCGRSGSDSPECAAANAQVMSSEMSVQQAELKLEIARKPASAEDIAAAEKAVQSAQASLASAQAKLATVQAGPTAAELASAKSAVDSARATLNAKISGPTAEEVALGEESIKQAQISVQQAELNLKNATIVAPFDGVVASIGANVGEQVGGSTAMFTLVEPGAVRVDVTVAETDLPSVAVGQAATITFDAIPDKSYQGKVVAISPTATVSQGVVYYVVSIDIDAGDASLPAGLTASANIVTAEKAGVLMVPNRAVRLSGYERVVDVLVDGKEETRQVQVGMSNEQFTEIVSGLAEGDQILIKQTGSSLPGMGGVGVRGGMGGMSSGVMIREGPPPGP